MPGFQRYCPYTVATDEGGEWKAPEPTRARHLIRASGTFGQSVVVWSEPDFQRDATYLAGLRNEERCARQGPLPLLGGDRQVSDSPALDEIRAMSTPDLDALLAC